jgi:rare lipoprotein A (peptidoglycan hydrolase)
MMPDIVKSESCRPASSRGRLLVVPLAASLVVAFLDCCAPALSAHARPSAGWSGAFGPTVGIASYYGKEFNGRKTASGERFDMNKCTAAHRTLPFGTMVKVTNMQTGASVVVRINDRGPFSRARIIDLSFAAAAALGIDKTGKARVRIEAAK